MKDYKVGERLFYLKGYRMILTEVIITKITPSGKYRLSNGCLANKDGEFKEDGTTNTLFRIKVVHK